jgi:hypothetical protein
MNLIPAFLLTLALSSVACGGAVDPTSSTGSSTDTSSSSTSTGMGGSTSSGTSSGTSSSTSSGMGGSSAASRCPLAEPMGGACDSEGLRCTWGDEVRAECRSARTCTGGAWSAPGPACATPPADHCQFTEPPTGMCMQYHDICIVGAATICRCDFSDGGPSDPFATWRCSGPPSTPGCPAVAPNDGSACAAEGLECRYGNFCIELGADARCTSGAWRWNQDTNDITCAS